jgi:peptidoglycan hydrolase FlgJ
MSKIDSGIQSTYMSSDISSSRAEQLQKNRKDSKTEIDKAASGFESLLVHKMLQEMWSTSSDGIFGENSNQAQIFRDMFNQAVADEISKGEGMGVKKFISKELSRQLAAAESEMLLDKEKTREKIA